MLRYKMSRMIPSETLAVLRDFNDVTIELYGIECDLYIPSNLDTVESLDVYATVDDMTYTEYEDEKVFIEWSPSISRLRKLGIFSEGMEIPMIAWFKNSPEVTINSYIKVPVGYIPDDIDTDEFDINDVLIKHMHDAVVVKAYKIAPRRIK